MNLTNEQRKRLAKVYPYLIPHNVFTDNVPEDYDYSYIVGESSIPQGWFKLFLLYCKAIKSVLESNNYINEFRFYDIKEKYGSLRISYNGLPESATILTYMCEKYSSYVCARCGNIARFISNGYIEPWCEDCISSCRDTYHKIYTPSVLKLVTYNSSAKKTESMIYSLKKLHKDYKRCLLMTDDEFFNYIISS